MKKSPLRMICALLACTMMPLGAIACAQDTEPKQTNDTTLAVNDSNETEPSETTDDGKDENGFIRDNLPDDLNFGNETATFLTWSDVEHEEFTVEGLTGETINDAIYNRNQRVQSRLGVQLNFYGIPGNADNIASYAQHVANAIQAGSHDFDICAPYSLTLAAVAAQGYMLNLLDLPYLDFEKPWWPERLTSEATINNKLFFASGDISANLLYMMYTCFFNKGMIEDYDLPNPQDLVQSGEWTYDKFFEMCQGVYADLNGNQEKDSDDRFGYMTSGIHTDPWFFGAGNHMVEKDESGKLIPSPSFSNERAVDIVDFVNTQFWTTNDAIYTSKVRHQNAFAQSRLLFCVDRARTSITVFSESDVQYGIVPFPKYDTAQASYVTVIGNPFTLYGLPSDCRDPEMMAAVLECFASEGYRQVTPALFEITLKVKYSDDAVSSEMYDLIRENVTFDLGRIFSNTLITQTDFRKAVQNNQDTWASHSKTRSELLATKLDTLQKAFE